MRLNKFTRINQFTSPYNTYPGGFLILKINEIKEIKKLKKI